MTLKVYFFYEFIIKCVSGILQILGLTVKILGLTVTNVQVPPIIEVGKDGLLRCEWNLDGETLYSVKWYQGLKEIYRYTPSKQQPIQIFSNDFLQVDVCIVYTILKISFK